MPRGGTIMNKAIKVLAPGYESSRLSADFVFGKRFQCQHHGGMV